MSTPDPLLHAATAFVMAGSWEASKAVLEVAPDLVSQQGEDVLAELAANAQRAGEQPVFEAIEEHRRLLARCRTEGLDAVFSRPAGDGGGGTGGSLEQILGELAAPATVADMPRRIALCRQALDLLPLDEDPLTWAMLQAELGRSHMQSTLGDRGDHIERAIRALKAAEEALVDDELVVHRAERLNELSIAYASRVRGDPADNQWRAVRAGEEALELLPVEQSLPRARVLNNLGNVLLRMSEGGRARNIDRAIRCFREAAELFAHENRRLDQAIALTNQASALAQWPTGSRTENLEDAVTLYERALGVLSPHTNPREWAQAQAGLGVILQSFEEGDRAARLERAVRAFRAALDVLPEDTDPLTRARILNNLGNAIQGRLRGDPARNSDEAIDVYHAALRVLTPSVAPVDWAQTMCNLGHAYALRPSGAKADNVRSAIEHYEAALQQLDGRSSPLEYAQIAKHLGTALRELPDGDVAANRRRAMQAYEQALRLRTTLYGDGHPRVASVLRSIGELCIEQEEFDRAVLVLERAVAIDREHPEVERELAADQRLLARALEGRGDHRRAGEALGYAIGLEEFTQGPTGGRVADDLAGLAKLLVESGDSRQAALAGEHSVAVAQAAHGPTHPRVVEALAHYAEVLRDAGKLTEAEDVLKLAAERDRNIYGPANPRLSRLLIQQAEVLREAGEIAAAKEVYREALRIQEALYGPDDPRIHELRSEIEKLPEAAPHAARRRVHGPGWRKGIDLRFAFSRARVRFDERLVGYVARGVTDPDQGYRDGRREAARMWWHLSVDIEKVSQFMEDAEREATVTGRIEYEALRGELAITDGGVNVVIDPGEPDRRSLVYRLCVEGPDGPLTLVGRRQVVESTPRDAISNTTTVRVLVMEGHLAAADAQAPIVAAGRVHMRHPFFIEHLASIRADGASLERRREAVEQVGRLLHGGLWETHAGLAVDVATSSPPPS